MPNPLAIIPLFLAAPADLEIVVGCLRSLRATTENEPCDVLVVDDCSPRQDLVDALDGLKSELWFELERRPVNAGFSATVNVGLRRCLEEGRDAVLVNADIEFIDPGWLRLMQEQPRQDGEGLASVVGALLLYPSGLIQHAGVFFSLLVRSWDHMFRYGPGDLPEAQHARVCPVTGALQFIRHNCLAEIGVYDERFRMGFEDVSYCIDALKAGHECVYQPKVRAYHLESVFRGRPSKKLADWQNSSWLTFADKHRADSFAQWVPALI